MNVRGYIRKSKYFPTIEEQTELIKSYCDNNDYTLLNTYIDDNPYYGNDLSQRPGLESLLNDLQSKELLVVCFINRLYRNFGDLLNLYDFVDKKDIFLTQTTSSMRKPNNEDSKFPYNVAATYSSCGKEFD